MSGYLLRRIVTSMIVLVGISMVMFLLLHIIYPRPGRDVLGLRASGAAVAAWNRQNGFAGPVTWQYWRYVYLLLHGNLGYSVKLNEPVSALFAQRWARSAYLSGLSLALAMLVTFPLGIFQAVRRNGLTDQVATAVEFVLIATPPFLFYLLAIQVLALGEPVFGFEASQSDSLLTVITDWHDMALPVGCLTVVTAAALSRYMRSAAIDALAQDYIKIVRAKGLPERLVLSRHLLRNSSLPMITVLGLSVPALLAGDFFVETVFNYKGLGLAFLTGLQDLDYPVLLAYTLVGAVLTVLGNLTADIALTVADPRIRFFVPSW